MTETLNSDAPAILPEAGASAYPQPGDKKMSTEDTHIVLTDARLPTDHLILEGVDVAKEPVFTVSEIAKVFYARSPHWIRWRERKGYFVLEPEGGAPEGHVHDFDDEGHCACGAEDVGGQRTSEGARRYTLADIEKMTHALASKGAINGAQLTNALLLVQTEARVWGYIQ